MTKPLKGISILDDYGNIGRSYRVDCSCGDSSHQLTIFVNNPEKDNGVAIEIFSSGISSTKLTRFQRLKCTVDMSVYGKYTVETDVILDKEVSENLLDTLCGAYRNVIGDLAIEDTDNTTLQLKDTAAEKVSVEVDTEFEDYIGILITAQISNDPYLTWKKRIAMATSILVRGYYEFDIDLQLNDNDANMLINMISSCYKNLV